MMRMGWRKVRRVGVVFLKGRTISACFRTQRLRSLGPKTLLSFQDLSAGWHLLRTGKIQVTVPEGVSSGQQIQVGLAPDLRQHRC